MFSMWQPGGAPSVQTNKFLPPGMNQPANPQPQPQPQWPQWFDPGSFSPPPRMTPMAPPQAGSVVRQVEPQPQGQMQPPLQARPMDDRDFSGPRGDRAPGPNPELRSALNDLMGRRGAVYRPGNTPPPPRTIEPRGSFWRES